MDRWTDRLSEYLDGSLTQAEQEALDAHLATCLECRSVIEQLRRVVDRARGLDDRPPTKDLWSGIATRIGSSGGTAVVPINQARTARTPARTSRRLSFSLPQAVAAGIALVAVSSGAVWLALRTPNGSVAKNDRGSMEHLARWPLGVDSTMNGVVEDLRGTLDSNRSQLDTGTVRVLEKNLAIIDSAIAEARRALAQDPNNNYLNHHLADTMRRKADLLRRASALGTRT